MIDHGLRPGLRQRLLASLASGRWWHPHYFRWRWDLLKHPEFDNGYCASIMRSLRYSPFAASFFKEAGPQRLLDHELTPQSLVLDVGAYTGEWSREIYQRYEPRILAFEPMPQFYMAMKAAFADQPKVSVYNFGLSDSDRKVSMDLCGMGSSEFSSSRGLHAAEVTIRDVLAVFQELQIEAVDVLKINIEGGEFPLLERMLECNLLSRCNKIMVQFHKYVLPTRRAIDWRERLVCEIEKTHAPIFKYPFVWEGWNRRQPG
jgi:FkbM family methyltransferase